MDKLEWFYVDKDERIGPFSNDELGSLIDSGKISENTLVWNHTFSDWKKFGTVQIKTTREVIPQRVKPEQINPTEIKIEDGKKDGEEQLSSGLKFLGVVIMLLTVHRFYLAYQDIYFYRFIIAKDLPFYFFLFIILRFVNTALWCFSFVKFRARQRGFLPLIKITTILSCLPIVISLVMYRNIETLFNLSVRNMGLVYIAILIVSFTYLKSDSVKEVFVK